MAKNIPGGTKEIRVSQSERETRWDLSPSMDWLESAERYGPLVFSVQFSGSMATRVPCEVALG